MAESTHFGAARSVFSTARFAHQSWIFWKVGLLSSGWEILRYQVSAAIDDDGGLHLSYLKNISTEESPAGVYYVRSVDNGETWSAPLGLYDSLYFFALSNESANIHLSTISSGGESYVFAVWDNPLLDRVFLIRSVDAGRTWEAIREVDKRSADDAPRIGWPLENTNSDKWPRDRADLAGGHGSVVCDQYYPILT